LKTLDKYQQDWAAKWKARSAEAVAQLGSIDEAAFRTAVALIGANSLNVKSSCNVMHQLALADRGDLVPVAVEPGADIDARDINHLTPLCYAVLAKSYNAIAALVKAGACLGSKETLGSRLVTLFLLSSCLNLEPQ